MATLTCHTSGCTNDGIGITYEMTYVDENGDTQTIGSATCGACGQPITDIADGA